MWFVCFCLLWKRTRVMFWVFRCCKFITMQCWLPLARNVYMQYSSFVWVTSLSFWLNWQNSFHSIEPNQAFLLFDMLWFFILYNINILLFIWCTCSSGNVTSLWQRSIFKKKRVRLSLSLCTFKSYMATLSVMKCLHPSTPPPSTRPIPLTSQKYT